MTKRGRPAQGTQKIESLAGSSDAKHRLKVIMDSISGELSIAEACKKLGLEKSAFYRLRDKALSGALSSLEPKEVGRPRNVITQEQEYIEDLEAAMQLMRIDLEAARVREELAVTMPHVLRAQYEQINPEVEYSEAALKKRLEQQKHKNRQARKQQRKAKKKSRKKR